MTDEFKSKNIDHYPNTKAIIKPCKKQDLYSFKFDTATDVSYSFYNTTETSNVDSLARSFIYVNISVLNDEAFAKEIYQKIIRILPEFVETNMAVPAGYVGTNCQQIT